MGLCVFSLPVIVIFTITITIKLEVSIISHCLKLGRETMVCAVCLVMSLSSAKDHYDDSLNITGWIEGCQNDKYYLNAGILWNRKVFWWSECNMLFTWRPFCLRTWQPPKFPVITYQSTWQSFYHSKRTFQAFCWQSNSRCDNLSILPDAIQGISGHIPHMSSDTIRRNQQNIHKIFIHDLTLNNG